MRRKSLKTAMYNNEITKELDERQLKEKVNFGEKGKSMAQSSKQFMKKIDDAVKGELYEHKQENCSKECEKRGCQWVITLDGLWKLSYPICMWINNNKTAQKFEDILPNVCTEEPEPRKAFCKSHCKTVEHFGKPSGLREFINSCGANSDAYTKDGKTKVKSVLVEMSKKYPTSKNENTFADSQGILNLLENKDLMQKQNVEVDDENEECRKDIAQWILTYMVSNRCLRFLGGLGYH